MVMRGSARNFGSISASRSIFSVVEQELFTRKFRDVSEEDIEFAKKCEYLEDAVRGLPNDVLAIVSKYLANGLSERVLQSYWSENGLEVFCSAILSRVFG